MSLFWDKLSLTAGIFIFLVGHTARGEVPEKWQQLADVKDREVIQRYFAEKDKDQWLHLASSDPATPMKPEEKTKQARGRRIAALVVQRLVGSLKPVSQLDEKEIKDEIETLSVVSKRMRAAGGYTNFVYADTLNRVALSQLCFWQVAVPTRHKVGRELLEKLSFPAFPETGLVPLIEEEAGISDVQLKFKDIKKRGLIITTFSVYKQDYLKYLGATDPKAYSNGALLQHSNVPCLVHRLALTELFASVWFPGLLEFQSRGGDRKSLMAAKDSVTKFNQLIGGPSNKYKCELIGVGRLHPANLLKIYDAFEKTPVSRNFLLDCTK